MGWIGIDPGLEGAVALIQDDNSVRLWDTPYVKVESSAKTKAGNNKIKRLYDGTAMVAILDAANIVGSPLQAIIELVGAMPDEGPVAAFKFGEGWGLWKGMLYAKHIPFTVVSPVRWRNQLVKDLPKGKAASAIRAGELYPTIGDQLRGPRGGIESGRADAILLAHYGRLQPAPGTEQPRRRRRAA